MTKRFLVFSVYFFTCISVVFAQSFSNSNVNKPRLVVGIVIEQMRPDYITRYWNTFDNDGFKRIAENGARFNGARNQIHNLKTSTGIATIFTGTYPSNHGIVGDQWFRQLTSEQINCIGDNFYMTVGSDSYEGNCSAKMVQTFTLGDRLKSATNSKSKVFSVALNAKAAVLSAGHSADGAYWFDKTNGNMISSSYYLPKFPSWVSDFNDLKNADFYLTSPWDLIMPLSSYDAGNSDSCKYEKGFFGKQNTFPYNLQLLSEGHTSKYEILKASPWGNKLIAEFASKLIEKEDLGEDEFADLLSITFSSLDFANKWFGPSSVEMHDVYLRLDREIANLLKQLDKSLGKDNYLIFLTSPSGSSYSYDILKNELNFPAGEFSPKSASALLKLYLNAVYGVGDWLVMYNEEQIYFNHDLIEKKDMSLEDMQRKVALFVNQFEGVSAAVPGSVIEVSNLNNQRFVTFENSYSASRSGDVMIQLKDGWSPVFKYEELDYTNESRIPLMFYGSGIKSITIDDNVDGIDIVPTICKYLNILPPDKASGRVLNEIFW